MRNTLLSKNAFRLLFWCFAGILLNTHSSWGQTSTQDFGTGTGSHTSSTGSVAFIPNGTSGTTWARGGAIVPNAPINLVNTSNPLGTTGSYVRAAASASTSVAKFSPWIGYTGGTEFYTSFKVLFGDASAGSTATSGIWSFYQGAGAMYTGAVDFAGAQVFTGIRFTFGAGGALALTYRESGSWVNTNLTTSTFSSGTVYTVEIVGNNKTSGTINYSYGGVAQSVAVQKYDLYINGTKIGDDLGEALLPANTSITSGTFIGISSVSNAANVFVDDAITYNAVPGSIATSTITTWNGSTWSKGIPSITNEAVVAGAYSTTANGAFTANKVTVNSGSLTINSGTNMTVQNELINNLTAADVVVENNANLIQVNAIANTGNITVNRDSASLMRQDYTLWSSPVAAQQLQAFSPSTLAARFYTYNPSTNLYVTETATNNFAIGSGYLIRMPNDHPATATVWNGIFTGTPNNGTVNLTVTNATYNAIGNPYPSTINADAFITANSITEALYFWRKTNSPIITTSSYATYTLAGGAGTGSNSGDPLGLVPNGTIQVGQGFIAKSANTTLSFNNTMRVANNGNQFLRTTEDRNRIWLSLTNTDGLFSQTMVAYMPTATQGIDAAIDGRFFNDSQTALTSIINTEEFAIQGRALPFDTNDVVALGFKSELAGNYTITLDHFDGLFASGQDVFLKDNLTNTTHDLSAGSYNFATAAGIFNTRFEIVYQNPLSVNLPAFNENSVVVYKNNGAIRINSGSVTIDNIKIFDISGRLLAEKSKVNATETTIDSSKFGTQVLIVQITSDAQIKVSKKVVN